MAGCRGQLGMSVAHGRCQEGHVAATLIAGERQSLTQGLLSSTGDAAAKNLGTDFRQLAAEAGSACDLQLQTAQQQGVLV